MVKISLALLADYAVIAQGKLGVMGIYDHLIARQLPFLVPQSFLVIRILADKEDCGKVMDGEVRLLLPDGEEKPVLEGYMTVPEPGAGRSEFRHDQIFPLYNMALPQSGDYEYRVYLNQELKGTIPFTVTLEEKRA